MKTSKSPRLVQAVLCAVAMSTAPVSAILVNFQADYPLVVLDSQNNTITDSMGYVFQLGAFDNGFTPTASNKSLWADNWVIFTELNYYQPFIGDDPPTPGYTLGGSATLMADKLPTDPYIPATDPPYRDPADVGGYSSWYRLSVDGGQLDPSKPVAGSTFDFSGEQGYLWVFDSNDPSNARVEQFLATSSAWIFPNKFAEDNLNCCDNRDPENWFLSQIDEEPPIGEKPPGPPETIQLIPEPSSAVFGLIGALALLGRRRRN